MVPIWYIYAICYVCVGYQASRTALCLQKAGNNNNDRFVVVITNKSFDLRKLRPR